MLTRAVTLTVSPDRLVRSGNVDAPLQSTFAVDPALPRSRYCASEERRSDHPVSQHRVSHLLEAGDVGAPHIVDVLAAARASVFDAGIVDAPHDVGQQLLQLLLTRLQPISRANAITFERGSPSFERAIVEQALCMLARDAGVASEP